MSVLILIIVLGGVIGCMVFSILLDKTRKFKIIYATLFLIQVVGLGSATLGLIFEKCFPATACAAFFIGVGYMSTIPVMFEFTAEVTYPIGAAMSGGTAIMIAHLLGSVLVSFFLKSCSRA